MVKAYLRYELGKSFGVVTSGTALDGDSSGKLAITAVHENISLWNLRQGTQAKLLVTPEASQGKAAGEITQVAASPTGSHIAAGHADGTIRIWNLETGDCEVTLTGHRRAVTALRYSRNGSQLASGSQDTDVILWDVIAESGLFRLRAHTAEVTDLAFIERSNTLVTCSKDGYVRVWDLGTQHCYQILLGQQGEVWSLDVDAAEQQVAVGGVSPQLQLYRIHSDSETGGASSASKQVLQAQGGVARQAPERVARLRYSRSGQLLACQSAGKLLELFRTRSEKEVKKHVQRRKKRKRDKAAELPEISQEPAPAQDAQDAQGDVTASDLLAPLQVIRTKHKLKAFTFAARAPKGCAASLTLALGNNTLEAWSIMEDEEPKKAASIETPGHRAGPRALALSSDDAVLLSAAAGEVKLWNPRSGACLRSIESGQGLCAMFAPGNRHAIVGTKDGAIQILDIAASAVLETLKAHEGAVWSVVPLPDGSGFVSCSADHSVKFWEWEILSAGAEGSAGQAPASRRLSARHARTLKMADDVLCICISPDGRLIAAALLDSTIQVHFMDSLKFFLSLYGHKLPVLSMDISTDSSLLISGSADKNIKIWGLDFGDCHRSLFAHADSIMQVAFVPNTHYAFTVGKDGAVKYWDADRWELLLTLEGHKAEAWCLVVSSMGDFVVTSGADRALRVWQRTEEPFFVEEEKEKRLESLFEADLEESTAPQRREGEAAEATAAPAGRKTLEVVSGAERIADALALVAAEAERVQAFEEDPTAGKSGKGLQPNPLLLGLTPEQYMLKQLASVRASDLEQAFLILPFSDALRLLSYFCTWLERGAEVELVSRAATLLVRLHHAQLVATVAARAPLLELRRQLRRRTQQLKDRMGFNLAALSHLQRGLKQQHEVAAM
ncbi:g13253 [Coccomyxa viridis]|uniref:G13253 protein n=1 Tax=Coccomyxa viridis TaxID=1274662 RepID=A0ABP1GCD8_9CHLO